MFNFEFFMYSFYIAVSVGLTVWLARTLSRNGDVFLVDVFPGQKELAHAVNQLLVVGFYLLNLGWSFWQVTALRLNAGEGTDVGLRKLTVTLGTLMFSLAVIHFGNLYLFYRIRRRAKQQATYAPVPPTSPAIPPGYDRWVPEPVKPFGEQVQVQPG